MLSQSTDDIYIHPINNPQCVGPTTVQRTAMLYNISLAPHTMSDIAYDNQQISHQVIYTLHVCMLAYEYRLIFISSQSHAQHVLEVHD